MKIFDILFIIISVFVFLSIIISNLILTYDPVLDKIYDEKGQKFLILWYNTVKNGQFKRKYKVLMKI